jgi:protein translocase SecG subunit
MNTIEIIAGIVLILLCGATIFLTLFTKGEGGGLNAISGKGGNQYGVRDNNTALTKLIRNMVIAITIVSFAVNLISSHAI